MLFVLLFFRMMIFQCKLFCQRLHQCFEIFIFMFSPSPTAYQIDRSINGRLSQSFDFLSMQLHPIRANAISQWTYQKTPPHHPWSPIRKTCKTLEQTRSLSNIRKKKRFPSKRFNFLFEKFSFFSFFLFDILFIFFSIIYNNINMEILPNKSNDV